MPKVCEYCHAELSQRVSEDSFNFKRRRFCNVSCANKQTGINLKAADLARKPVCGVYMIRNLITDMRYVGGSTDIVKRWRNHRSDLWHGRNPCTRLQGDWNRYGRDAFKFIILEESDQEHLTEREQYWIDKLRSAEPEYGYNIAPRAGTPAGTKRTPQQIAAHTGSKSPVAKLDEDKVAEIKRRLVLGDTIYDLARDFNVYPTTIGKIRNGNIWKHVLCPELIPERLNQLTNQRHAGEGCHFAKLKAVDVIEIRRLLAEGQTGKSLAKQYGVSCRHICAIKNGKVWKELLPT
jgi:hypothetical protein